MARSDFFHVPAQKVSINLSQIAYIAWTEEKGELVARPTAMNGGVQAELHGEDAQRLRDHVGYENEEDVEARKQHGGVHA